MRRNESSLPSQGSCLGSCLCATMPTVTLPSVLVGICPCARRCAGLQTLVGETDIGLVCTLVGETDIDQVIAQTFAKLQL